MTTTRAVALLPIAALLTIVPAVVAGVGPPSNEPEPAESPESGLPPDGSSSGEDGGTAASMAPPPTTVDLATQRDELLAAGQAVESGGLMPGLEAALDAARAEAADDGIELVIASGYRSAEEQLTNLENEIAERGSVEDALHWVFTPDRSMHVRGLAIDLGSGPAADWLQIHGGRFGLCKSLAWEWWHFEWRQRWQDAGTCPPPADSPAEAPPA